MNPKIAQKLNQSKNFFVGLGQKMLALLAPVTNFFIKIKNAILATIARSKILQSIFSRRTGIIVVASILLIYIISAAVFATGVYKYNWSGKARKFATSVYPLPASYSGGQVVWLKNFDKSYDQSLYFMQKNNQPITDANQFKRDMLDQMIDIEVWKNQAKKYKIKVSKDDFNSSYAKLIEQAGGEDKAKEMLSQFWGMSLDDLKQLIWDQLPKEKLTEKMQTEVLTGVQAQHILITNDENLAKDVAAKAKAGGDFAALAKEYSQDATTKDQGGELGWFNRGVMDADFEKAAFSMKVGDISDPVKSQLGFHIIKIENLRGTIDKSLTDWFSDIKSKTKIIKFVAK